LDENLYRTAQFSQDTRLQAANQARCQLITQAQANPTDLVLNQKAGVAATEFLAVHKVGGVCEMLAMKWLKLKLKDADDKMGLIDRDKTFDKAFERRAHHASHSNQYGPENYYGLRAKAIQATKTQGTRWAAETVAHSVHDYFHHQIQCPKFNGNHSLAYYTSSGKILGMGRHVYVFDPDYGEYCVPTGKFPKWLPAFLFDFYGTTDTDTLKLETMSLRPQGKVTTV
jgi:hypothetical protein